MISPRVPSVRPLPTGLTRSLLGQDMLDAHGPWRVLFTREEPFAPDGDGRERMAMSYQRLRRINRAVADPLALAADVSALSALIEWVGIVDPGLVIVSSIHYNLFLGSLVDHDHADRDLTDFTEMRRIGTFLCTEAAHGNDASAMETTATFDRATGGFVLDTPTPGARKYMPNTSRVGGPKSAVVAARLLVDGADHGVFLFLTPLTDDRGVHLEGVEVHHLPETASAPIDHCATAFHQVRLPYEALLQSDHGRLSRDGDFTSSLGSPRRRFLRSIGRVTAGKLGMSSYSLGVMRHAVAVAVRYGSTRHTSGMTSGQRVPLLAHRSHHAPLLSAVATSYAASLLHREVIRQWTCATGEEREEVERLAAVSKGWITWSARDIMTECRERCGAKGLLLANGIAAHLAANEGAITAEGDNLVIWLKAGGEMLTGGLSPVPASGTDPAGRSLSDTSFLQELLSDLERVRQQDARSKLRTGGRPSPLARWNATSSRALSLVDAHAHRLAAQALLTAARENTSPRESRLLADLHRLFALEYLAKAGGELLAHGFLTPEQVLALPDAVDDCLSALEPHALELTEAFAIPRELLEARPMLAEAPPTADADARYAKPQRDHGALVGA